MRRTLTSRLCQRHVRLSGICINGMEDGFRSEHERTVQEYLQKSCNCCDDIHPVFKVKLTNSAANTQASPLPDSKLDFFIFKSRVAI